MKKNTYLQFYLQNNLKVLLVKKPKVGFVYTSLIGKVGRRAELDNEVGCAHFMEHIFCDRKNDGFKDKNSNLSLESKGGKSNAFTSSETVQYFAKILPENLETAFVFLSEIASDPSLENIDKHRKIITQEIAKAKNNFDSMLSRQNLSNLYPDQSIGRTIFDDEVHLFKIDKQVLQNYIDRTYVAENFVLLVEGNFNEKVVRDLASKYFVKFKKGDEVNFEKAITRKKKNIQITKKDTSQSFLIMSFSGFSFCGDEEITARLLAFILGVGKASRLNISVRENKHLVYSIYSKHGSFSDTGYFLIQTTTDESNLQKVIDEILNQIKLFLREGIEEEELVRAKNMALSELIFRFEEPGALSTYLANQLLFSNRIRDLDYIKKIIENNTIEDVVSISRKIFSDEPKVNIITKSSSKFNMDFKKSGK